MRFFLSGELDIEVNDVWRCVRSRIEERLNSFCVDRDYGPMIRQIAVIPIILRPEWQEGRKERRLFQRKQASADYRTVIDFEKFKTGGDEVREKLLLKNIVEAIADLTRKAGRGFDGQRLIEDVLSLFAVTRQELELVVTESE